MPVNDLALGLTYGPLNPEQLIAGDAEIVTDWAPATAAFVKYELGALTATGLVKFVVGTHTPDQAVLVMQPVGSGQNAQYAHTGIFNDALITYPANAAIDTFAERKAFFNGRLRVAQIKSASFV